MQRFRKYALVVSLSTVIVVGAAGTVTPSHRHGSLDDDVIASILEFFGFELKGRLSTPPG